MSTDRIPMIRRPGTTTSGPLLAETEPLDLEGIAAEHLRQCGSCDAGLPTACTCSPYDPRAAIQRLIAEVERMRPVVEAAEAFRDDGRVVISPLSQAIHVAVDAYRAAPQASLPADNPPPDQPATPEPAEGAEGVVRLLWDATGIPADQEPDFVAGAIRSMVDTARVTRTQLRPQLARAAADCDALRRAVADLNARERGLVSLLATQDKRYADLRERDLALRAEVERIATNMARSSDPADKTIVRLLRAALAVHGDPAPAHDEERP